MFEFISVIVRRDGACNQQILTDVPRYPWLLLYTAYTLELYVLYLNELDSGLQLHSIWNIILLY